MAEEEQTETTTDLVRRFAEKAGHIYETRTAGDYTWAGLLYHFLDEYRKQMEKAWDDIENTNSVGLWRPKEADAEPTPNLSALYEAPLIEVDRQYGDDARGTKGIHEMTEVKISLFPSQEASFMALLEQEFGRIT